MLIRRKSKESKEIVIVDSIGFQQVAVLAIGMVLKGAVEDSRFRILHICHIFSPHGTDFSFQMYGTHL